MDPHGPLDNNAGIEALAFYTSPLTGHSRLLAGRQSDARVFAFDINQDRTKLHLRGSVLAPGPGRDLAAISVFLGRVCFVFDKKCRAVSVLLEQFDDTIVKGRGMPYEGWRKEEYEFGIRGHEGLAFAYGEWGCVLWGGGVWETRRYFEGIKVVCAVDPPGKKGKDVVVNTF